MFQRETQNYARTRSCPYLWIHLMTINRCLVKGRKFWRFWRLFATETNREVLTWSEPLPGLRLYCVLDYAGAPRAAILDLFVIFYKMEGSTFIRGSCERCLRDGLKTRERPRFTTKPETPDSRFNGSGYNGYPVFYWNRNTRVPWWRLYWCQEKGIF